MADLPSAERLVQAAPRDACPICSEENWTEHLSNLQDRLFDLPGEFSILVCRECGTWRLWPVPDNLGDYYPDDYSAHVNMVPVGATRPWHHTLWKWSFSATPAVREYVRRKRLWSNEAAQEMWRTLSAPPASIFDYGCGSGRFLRYAAQLGARTFGVDLSKNAVAAAREAGIAAEVGTYEDLPLRKGEQFELVRAAHVLEHVSDPVATLLALRPHVAPGGTLSITVPNTASGAADLFERDWYNLDAPRHLWGFNERNLGRAFEAAGFKVGQVIHVGVGSSIYQSLNYALDRKGSIASMPMPPVGDVLDALQRVADQWNSRNLGDWIIMTGKVRGE